MIVKSSLGAKLKRERTKAIQEHREKRERFVKQTRDFEQQTMTFNDAFVEKIREYLSPEINAFDPITISVDKIHYRSWDSSGPESYVIRMKYQSQRDDYHDSYGSYSNGHDMRGISWDLSIFLRTKSDGEVLVNKDPKLSVSYLDSNDYDSLAAVYDLFTKIDKIDWITIITQANNDAPNRQEIITQEPVPEHLNTHAYDVQIDQYDLDRIIGKDAWVRVRIEREDSFRDTDKSKNPGVTGFGWMKIISSTNTFYTFYWLPEYSSSGERHFGQYRRWYGIPPEDKYTTSHSNLLDLDFFSPRTIEQSLAKPVKLKKIYIRLAKPIQYRTTEELTANPEDVNTDYYHN